MRFVGAFLLAFLGALAWFIWAEANQTNGSCFRASHYVPSAVTALIIVVVVQIATEVVIRSSGHGSLTGRRPMLHLATGAVATAILMAVGLLIGGFFAVVTGCSA